jgi:hypothetical protein
LACAVLVCARDREPTDTPSAAFAPAANSTKSPGLIPLNSALTAVPAHGTVNHDYVVASDRFGGTYPWPSASALTAAGGFDQHFAHMSAYWNCQLAGIAQILRLPDQSLVDAYGPVSSTPRSSGQATS